ncbi:bifunctional glutamate N-acetyltransferase/amino-acid acetyltransferase ArgJ [Segniliparus rugosus]|uniref:Arginine biosynthesis bifunctional protein ArgJ n=1 Tax=Segniliparus rugosus (strain ATCC BAA-974 / DSM 45345 / CCUG 50838 / CIP 108380 / JCM 13579 / CDC 945) TaxID=679197 RepID=E5XMF4_SEGRC|nr:bifunctional glutamate N-acetyltransferase/amino-acid acetyltransferase ArgJ [Segniliparus rugosus]EFV14466.1 glutamate N-acetyltransferase/amino-acid acetyltransferase [Segniliparus rugosus ATCC BAA-974]
MTDFVAAPASNGFDVPGFVTWTTTAGLKNSGSEDMALVLNIGPHDAAAGVFTRNKVKAAPVLWTQQVLKSGALRAVLLNAGNANACTGPDGFADTHRSAERVAQSYREYNGEPEIAPIQVAVCSTGLIGERLPIAKVLNATDRLAMELSMAPVADWKAVARAIMTTDTVPKLAFGEHPAGWKIGGVGKGAAMLAPSLATMLVVVTTDAVATPAQLDQALRRATALTFDRLDVDGVSSTNDTVLLLSSGASGVEASQDELDAAVFAVCESLAAQMQADAEGVTKRVVIRVAGAASEDEAVAAARVVARDSLVKTALFGSDPNWGRVLAAVGCAPVELDPDKISVQFNGHQVCANGAAVPGARDVDLSGPDIAVEIDLGVGEGSGWIRTTDLSTEYVRLNSAYST